jgi:hypothetical protein
MTRSAPGGGVAGEHEGIIAIERPLAELAAAAREARICDAKLLTLVLAHARANGVQQWADAWHRVLRAVVDNIPAFNSV